MDTQWITLVGVGLGGLVGFAGTYVADRRASRERQLTRWDESRLRAYFDFGAAVKQEIRTCDRLATTRGFRNGAPPIDLAKGTDRLEAESDARTMLLEQVRLVGSTGTTKAAQDLQQAAANLHPAVLDPSGDDPRQTYIDLFEKAGAARAEFYSAARRELKIDIS